MKKIVLVMMLLPAVILSAVERDIVLGGGAWQADVLENLEINSSRAGEASSVRANASIWPCRKAMAAV